MTKQLKVEFKNVYKAFEMHAKQKEKLLELFSIERRKQRKEFVAVKDVSFKVYEGESVGIVGLTVQGNPPYPICWLKLSSRRAGKSPLMVKRT